LNWLNSHLIVEDFQQVNTSGFGKEGICFDDALLRLTAGEQSSPGKNGIEQGWKESQLTLLPAKSQTRGLLVRFGTQI
jgi:hypothetical protein